MFGWASTLLDHHGLLLLRRLLPLEGWHRHVGVRSRRKLLLPGHAASCSCAATSLGYWASSGLAGLGTRHQGLGLQCLLLLLLLLLLL